MKKWKLVMVILALALFLTACSQNTKSPEGPKEGQVDEPTGSSQTVENQVEEDIFPPFELENLDKELVTSEVFSENDINIVAIWQSTCGPCMGELEALNTIYRDNKDSGVNVIGISVDNVEMFGEEPVREVVEGLGLEYTNVISTEEYIYKLFPYVTGTPTAFILGKDGQFIEEAQVGSLGVEGDIEKFQRIIDSLK